MAPISFHPVQVFDRTKYIVDPIAKTYLQKATDDVRRLLPADVPGDGNCLYHSIVLLMNNSSITPFEMRGKDVYFVFQN